MLCCCHNGSGTYTESSLLDGVPWHSGQLFKSWVEGGLSSAERVSYDGARTDVDLFLPRWKAYEVSGGEPFASRHIRSKPAQPLAGQELACPVCAQCAPQAVSRGERLVKSFRRPT
jgi:hypothetical protein